MANVKSEKPDLKAIREELGLTQNELASYLGVSSRTVQSCEQGWRCPGSAVHKSLLLLLITHRRGAELKELHCWDARNCALEMRERCLVSISGQGHLCWFLTGNLCKQTVFRRWEDKLAKCNACGFFQALTRVKSPPIPDAAK